MLMKTKIFQKIGFLDENLFLYYDDKKFPDRSTQNNYKNILVKSSHVYHSFHNRLF